MTLDLVYLLILRIAHITAGVLWVGSSIFVVVVLLPTVKAAGAEGNRFVARLGAGNMTMVLASSAGITILAGILLYIHNIAVIGGSWARSGPGLVFGIGAVFGIVSGFVGGSMLGPLNKKLGTLGAEIAATGGTPSAEQAQQMAALSERQSRISRIALGTALIALLMMEVARYIPS